MSMIAVNRDIKSVISSLAELNKDYNVLESKFIDLKNNRLILPKKYNGIINLLDIFKKSGQ